MLPAGRISHFTSKIYPSLVPRTPCMEIIFGTKTCFVIPNIRLRLLLELFPKTLIFLTKKCTAKSRKTAADSPRLGFYRILRYQIKQQSASTEFRRSSSDQTPAVTEAVTLSHLFRRPSYVNHRHRYSTPYQRQTPNIHNRRTAFNNDSTAQQTTDQMLF